MAKALSFKGKVLQIAGGTAVAQGILVLTSPLLTRLYTPADFGIIGAYTSLIGIMATQAALRMENAIPLPDSDEDAAHMLAGALITCFLNTFITGTAVMLLRHKVAGWFHAPALAGYLWLLPLSAFGAGVNQILTTWSIRQRAYKHIARTKVTQAFSQVLVQVVWGLTLKGPLGLLLGDAFGRTNGSGTLARLAWKDHAATFKKVRLRPIWTQIKRYRHFPMISSWSSLVNTLGSNLPVLMLTTFYGPEPTGYFNLAIRLSALPITVIANAVAQVYFAESARLRRENPEGMMVLFKGTVRKMLMLGLPVVLMVAVASRFVFPRIFGAQWLSSAYYFQAIALMNLAQFAASCTGPVLDVVERQDLSFFREVTRLVLNASSFIVSRMLGFDAWHAVIVYGITGVLEYIVYGGASWWAIHSYLKRRAA